MSYSNRPSLSAVFIIGIFALGLSGCATGPTPEQPLAPAGGPALPPAFPPQDIVGRWGLAAYHKDEDRARTEAAAAGQCKQPYVITLGPSGGVMMHLADEATPTELRLRGGPGGKTFIGPADGEPGGAQDREVVFFNGRILILRWMDFGSSRSLRHHGLCPLRRGRRQDGCDQAKTQAENGTAATKACAVTVFQLKKRERESRHEYPRGLINPNCFSSRATPCCGSNQGMFFCEVRLNVAPGP